MLKPLLDVTLMLQKKGYTVTHAKDDATGHEFIQASLSPGDIPFMTFSYDKKNSSLVINTELQFPDTFTIADIALNCMKMHKTMMGKAFLVVPKEDGQPDVLYDNEAYDYIAKKMQEADEEMEAMIDDPDSQYFRSRKTDKPGSGSVH